MLKPLLKVGDARIPSNEMTVADAEAQVVVEAVADATPPLITALPIRSRKVAVLMHAPGNARSPAATLVAARAAPTRRLGASGLGMLCFGLHQTAEFHNGLAVCREAQCRWW